MRVSEKEAPTKWCPFARAPYSMDIPDTKAGCCAANRDADGLTSEADRCLGPECMAWQWDGVRKNPDNTDDKMGRCGLTTAPRV